MTPEDGRPGMRPPVCGGPDAAAIRSAADRNGRPVDPSPRSGYWTRTSTTECQAQRSPMGAYS
jgi:hypothetical protein